jgi:hypothetical protein
MEIVGHLIGGERVTDTVKTYQGSSRSVSRLASNPASQKGAGHVSL